MVAAVGATTLLAVSNAAAAGPRASSPYGPGLLVRFRSGVSFGARRRALRTLGLVPGSAIAHTGFELVDASPARAARDLSALRRLPIVEDAELNYVRHTTATPDDPIYAKSSLQAYLNILRLPQAWGVETGSSTLTIAIVDTGVNPQEVDLAGRVLPGKTFVSGTSDSSDDNGHGTFVAGVAAANTNNGVGIAGVAWNARILPVKVLDSNGDGTDADIASGITWAADNGADVINLSFGGPSPSQVVQNAVDYALSKNVVVVAAAGNNGNSQPQYPAADAGVLAVSATDWAGDLTDFSSYGPWIDVAAPGVNIVGPENSGFESESGTSFAAPIVAGVAALVRAQNPSWTQQQVVNDIEHTARDVGSPGFDDEYGYGIVDAYAALGGGKASRPAIAGDASEPNDVPDRATVITSNTPLSATIAPEGDVDWYVRQVSGTGEITWTVEPPNLPAGDGDSVHSMDLEVEAYGPDLRFLGRAGYDGTVTVPVEQTGNYYLKVWSRNGSRSIGQYTVDSTWNPGSLPRTPYFFPPDVYWFADTNLGDPESVAVGDVTGDGRADIAVATGSYFLPQWDSSVVLYQQTPDGWLADPVRLPLLDGTQVPDQVAIGDINGDGKDDLVVAGSEGIDVYLQSNGTVAPSYRIPNTADTRYFTLADVNGDGRLDIVALIGSPGTTAMSLVVLLNTGSGFTAETLDTLDRPCVSGCSYAVVGDVNGDGRPDIVESGLLPTAGGGNEPIIRTWLQTASGTFTSSDIVLSSSPGPLEIGDLNGDGRSDLVTTNGSELDIYYGTPSGLGAPTELTNVTGGFLLADVNGDGRTDLVLSGSSADNGNAAGDTMLIYLQTTSGTLTEQTSTQGYFQGGWNAAVGDINGDGKMDIVSGGGTGGGLIVLRNYDSAWPRAPLWIRSTSPANNSEGVATNAVVTLHVARQLDPASISTSTVQLANGSDGSPVPAGVAYDAASDTVSLTPSEPLASGTPYVVTVSSLRDSSGDTMPRAYTIHFFVGSITDTSLPDTFITTPVAAYTSIWQHTFEFDASKPVQRFECSEDGGAWTTCSSPVDIADSWTGSSLTSGSHTFAVRAVDDAGNVDPTPAVASWAMTTTAPPNDNFASAVQLSGPSGSITGNNDAATIEPGEPQHAGNPGGASVWYTWTAPASGGVEFDTNGSAIDTLLAVYTGTAVNALTPVAANDDAAPGTVTSRVSFQAVAGTTYHIAVDGFDPWDGVAAEGNFDLEWAGATTTQPTVAITSSPTSSTTNTTATFEFDSSDAAAGLTCSLDGAAYSACTSPVSYSGLAVGQHTFSVEATDTGGTSSPATFSWTITSDTSGGLLSNGSFEGTTAGWQTWNASLGLASDGKVGSQAGLVTLTSADRFAIISSPKPVGSASAVPYTAGGWFRSDSGGRQVCLRIREWSGSTEVQEKEQCAAETVGWQAFPTVSLTPAAGDQLDVVVIVYNAVAGDSFEVDGLTLTQG